MWKLTEEALRNGIQSTTKYRKQANHRKSLGSECSTPLRVRPRPKSGKAIRPSSSKSRRRAEVNGQRIQRGRGDRQSSSNHHGTPEEDGLQQSSVTPPAAHVSSPLTTPTTALSTEVSFGMRHIIGCTDDQPPWDAMFYDNPGSDTVLRAVDQGYFSLCGCLPPPNSWLFGTDTGPDLSLGA